MFGGNLYELSTKNLVTIQWTRHKEVDSNGVAEKLTETNHVEHMC